MASGPESALVAKIIAALRTQGHVAWKNHGSIYSLGGLEDISVILQPSGRYAALEAKVGRNKPTALQTRRLEEVRAAGGIAACVYSVQEAMEAIHVMDTNSNR